MSHSHKAIVCEVPTPSTQGFSGNPSGSTQGVCEACTLYLGSVSADPVTSSLSRITAPLESMIWRKQEIKMIYFDSKPSSFLGSWIQLEHCYTLRLWELHCAAGLGPVCELLPHTSSTSKLIFSKNYSGNLMVFLHYQQE